MGSWLCLPLDFLVVAACKNLAGIIGAGANIGFLTGSSTAKTVRRKGDESRSPAVCG